MELTLFNSWQNVLSNDDDDDATSTPLLSSSLLFLSSGVANSSLLISLELSIVFSNTGLVNVDTTEVLYRQYYI